MVLDSFPFQDLQTNLRGQPRSNAVSLLFQVHPEPRCVAVTPAALTD